MPRLPSLRWRQDQSPPGLGLNHYRCPRARHPAAGCHRCCLWWRWDVVAAQAEATRGGARRRGKPLPVSGMRIALFPGPDGCAGAFLWAPRWYSWGCGGADEKGSRLAALAGFPDQPGGHRVAPCRDAESPGCGVRRPLVLDPAQAPHAPPLAVTTHRTG